jgi:triacylglycerol lipase
MLSAIARRAHALARRVVEQPPLPQPPLRPTRHPVVLMHGFGAVANLAPGGVLHAEAMFLRGHGIWAYAPHVNPYDTVAVRAAAWADRLERVFEETGAERVSLVGFSLGGLDARHLAADPAWRGRIAAIVTVATPHRGTPLATYLLEQPDRVHAWMRQVMTFVGQAAWEPAPPQVDAALAEMTPAHVEGVFAPAHPLPEGVWCASYSARAGAGTGAAVYPPLRVAHRILTRLAGENDGMVPTASAVWGEHLGTLEADHARLIGLRFGAGLDSKALYLEVAEHLRRRGL